MIVRVRSKEVRKGGVGCDALTQPLPLVHLVIRHALILPLVSQ